MANPVDGTVAVEPSADTVSDEVWKRVAEINGMLKRSLENGLERMGQILLDTVLQEDQRVRNQANVSTGFQSGARQ